MRRGLGLIVVLVVVSPAAGLGWIAGQRVKSPEQVAFETEPPPPSLIAVEVVLTELAADVITRADVGYDDPASFSLNGGLGGLPSVLLVTSAPERETELIEGSVAIEISGRPVFLVVGEIPVFRDLRPKAVGPDVRQLEEALARLGFLDGEPDEERDNSTGEAVRLWYEAAGYVANGISDQERSRIDTAGEAVEAAEEGVEDAEKEVDNARDRVVEAEATVGSAIKQVDAAIRRRSTAEDGVSRAQALLGKTEETPAEARRGPDEREIQRARRAVESEERQVRIVTEDNERKSEEAERGILAAETAREAAARAYASAESGWQSAQMGGPSRWWRGAQPRTDGEPQIGRGPGRPGA